MFILPRFYLIFKYPYLHVTASSTRRCRRGRVLEVVFVMSREGHRRAGVRVPLWVRILLCIGMGIIIILSRVKLVSFPEHESIHSAPLVGVNVNSLFTDEYLSGRAWGTYIPQLLFALTPGHSQWEGDDPRRAPVVGLLWSDANGKNLRYECEVPEKSRVTFRYAEHSHSSGKFVAEDAKLRSSISASWRVRSGAIDVNAQVVNRYVNRTVKFYFYVDDVEGSLGDYRISGLEKATQHQLKWPSAEKFNVAELIQLRKRKIRKNGKILPGFDLVDGGEDCKDQSCLSLWVVEVAENASLRVRLESDKIIGTNDADDDDDGYDAAVRRLWPNLKGEMYHAVASVVGGVSDTRGELVVKVREWFPTRQVAGSNPMRGSIP
ncbi:WD repeat-containing protein 19 [Perkinsus olseni]|uniref:WD repeat-containing protein 19 n=1 Tax=Perkinsus olseni TaxID=32597 RepID=A0A7J6QBF6_PEROL|nr:WD repeat-containing protein 19 [Perkinsus olseni]